MWILSNSDKVMPKVAIGALCTGGNRTATFLRPRIVAAEQIPEAGPSSTFKVRAQSPLRRGQRVSVGGCLWPGAERIDRRLTCAYAAIDEEQSLDRLQPGTEIRLGNDPLWLRVV